MAESARSRGVPVGNALLLAAGLADLAADRLGAVLDRFAAPPAYLDPVVGPVTRRRGHRCPGGLRLGMMTTPTHQGDSCAPARTPTPPSPVS